MTTTGVKAIRKFFVPFSVLLCLCSCGASKSTKPSVTEQYPRMPDTYRNNDYKDLSKRNPYGMSIYDAAENEAENEYFGVEVVPLEESRRILKERKAKQEAATEE